MTDTSPTTDPNPTTKYASSADIAKKLPHGQMVTFHSTFGHGEGKVVGIHTYMPTEFGRNWLIIIELDG